MTEMTRRDAIERLRRRPEISVLVVGAGINGAGVFRELALHDVDALLIDRGDYSCGTSAGPSRMVHAGLRYLEYGEYDLVRESVHERNLLLQNAPHYILPLPTTIPLRSRWGGLGAWLRRRLGLGGGKRAPRRGAWLVKLGLRLYDRYAEPNRQMPTHRFASRAEVFRRRPGLHPATVKTATYYDAWVTYPERLCMELILDAEAMSETCRSLNYVSLQGADGETVTLRDELTDEEVQVKPKAVVNATGAWIDGTNRRLAHESELIAGTKGAHLILDNDDLVKACDGEQLLYETDDGRVCLVYAWLGKAMIGSTDIRVDDPDEARCDDDEIDYMIGAVANVFPEIQIDRSQVLSCFTGVRPLKASSAQTTGAMSRSHLCHVSEANEAARFPVYSMVGGKWTPFRAFGEQAMDRLLEQLGMERKGNTESLAIGGGKGYPRTDEARRAWVDRVSVATGLDVDRVETLLWRYGTRGEQVAEFCAAGDRPLAGHETYTAREVEFILRNERVCHLDDLLLRRTAVALLGELNAALLEELLAKFGEVHGWPAEKLAAERERTIEILRDRHRVEIA